MSESSTNQDVIPSGAGRSQPAMAGAAPPGGVVSSNTPPLSSQWTGSEDWFEWVLYVDWQEEKWQEIQLKLEELKAIAEADVSPEEWDCLCVNEFEVNVEPCGARLGKGKKGPYYAYRAEYGGLDVMIAKCSTAKGNVPNVVIRASGEVCLLLGVDTCLKRGRNFVAGKAYRKNIIGL